MHATWLTCVRSVDTMHCVVAYRDVRSCEESAQTGKIEALWQHTSLYVCMYVCMYMCTRMCMCKAAQSWQRTSMCVCIYLRMYVCMFVCVCTCERVRSYVKHKVYIYILWQHTSLSISMYVWCVYILSLRKDLYVHKLMFTYKDFCIRDVCIWIRAALYTWRYVYMYVYIYSPGVYEFT
jgi:hypothetical protein